MRVVLYILYSKFKHGLSRQFTPYGVFLPYAWRFIKKLALNRDVLLENEDWRWRLVDPKMHDFLRTFPNSWWATDY